MYEEDNEIQGENDDDGKLNNFKEGSAIEGDVTDGEASDDDEENWIEDEDDTDGETRDGDKEYCPEKGNDTDSKESYDEEDIVMQDKGRYKKENEAMADTGKKRITKEKVEKNRKPKKEGKRAKKPCPVPRRDAKVVHLPKHLRNVHKWTTESSRLALTRFKLRKNICQSRNCFRWKSKTKRKRQASKESQNTQSKEKVKSFFWMHGVYRKTTPTPSKKTQIKKRRSNV